MIDSTAATGSIVNRMIRAARLDNTVYDEVEADRTATSQAAIVVVIVAICGAIGSALNAMRTEVGIGIVAIVLGGIIAALLGWVIWSYITYFIGTRLFGGTATPGEMLRCIGFANSPGVLNILVFVPVLGAIVAPVAAVWVLVAGIVAVRQALDISTGKAILTALIGWLIPVVLAITLAALGLGAASALGR